jgi:hypothetical protein
MVPGVEVNPEDLEAIQSQVKTLYQVGWLGQPGQLRLPQDIQELQQAAPHDASSTEPRPPTIFSRRPTKDWRTWFG